MRVRYLFVFVLLLLLFSASAPGSAHAVAIGPYLDLSSGSGEAEWEDSGFTFDTDATSFGVGFALDTAPTNEKVFNYRLNAGYNRYDHDDDDGDTLRLKGIVAENIFGFSIYRQPSFRWWLGPLVRVGFYDGDTSTGGTDFDMVEFGIGAVTGWNVKVNDKVIIAPSLGIRHIGEAGENQYGEEITNSFTVGFFNLAILFD